MATNALLGKLFEVHSRRIEPKRAAVDLRDACRVRDRSGFEELHAGGPFHRKKERAG
jgi:hypothetical protein